MAYSRLLLLLIGVISTSLPEVHTKPVDFLCKGIFKEHMEKMNITTQANCTGLDMLDFPVQLPCTRINAEWRNKNAEQKRVDVLEALQVFQHGVQHLKNETTLQCQTSLLGGLEQSITRLLNVVSQLHNQGDEMTPSRPSGEVCGNMTSFDEMVETYQLLKGKLKILAIDLCPT